MKKIQFSIKNYPAAAEDIEFKLKKGALYSNPAWPTKYIYLTHSIRDDAYEVSYTEFCFLKLGGEL